MYNRTQSYSDLISENELLSQIVLILFAISVLVIIRNWYNLYKKRSFRKLNKNLKTEIETLKNELYEQQEDLKSVSRLKIKLQSSQLKIVKLEKEIKESKVSVNKKEQEILKHKEDIYNQKRSFEKYIDYKTVEANNTRLGAHFIKNVINQIYEDLERTEIKYKSFMGVNYRFGKAQSKLPPIKALKNIFKLLDYNVAALNKDKISLEKELAHINMFLDLIRYLKPNAKVELNTTLNTNKKNSIKIKPTLFFPFVENALKHGRLNEADSFISIVLKETNTKQLSYCLVNSAEIPIEKSTKPVVSSSQFGLNALEQLVNTYYPGSELTHDALPNKQYMSQLILNLA